MRYFFLFIIVLLSGCSPKYLELTPSAEPLNKWDYPDGLSSQNIIFHNAEGIQVRDYSIRIDLGNTTEVLVVRYDMEANSDSYSKIISDIYPSKEFIKGPQIDLPEPSATFLVDISELKGYKTEAVIAVVPHYQKGLIAIVFSGSNYTEPEFLNEFISSIAFKGVPKNIIMESFPDSISFLDFKFKRNEHCSWMGPRNLECYPNGQMNWSIHSSLENAQKSADLQLHQTLSNDVKILRDDSIKVTFVGKNTIARRVKLKVSYPVLPFMTQSDILYAYYIVTNIDNEYIHWVGSFFEDQCYPGNLAPLFYEVMNYSEPTHQRIFGKGEFPSVDSIKSVLSKKNKSIVSISKQSISKSSFMVNISYDEKNEPFKLFVNVKNEQNQSLDSVCDFKEKLSKINENEASLILDHLDKSKYSVTYTRPESFNEKEWQIMDSFYMYLIENFEGIRQIDHAGFYDNKKMLLRM